MVQTNGTKGLHLRAVRWVEYERKRSAVGIDHVNVAVLSDHGTSVRNLEHQKEQESRVMVLYTGGTIGMRMKDGVYAPEPNYLPQSIRNVPHLNDLDYAQKYYGDVEFPPNVLPTVKGEERRILYWLFEYEPLLDSSNMTYDDWVRIAKDIMANYANYDGFLVLHGTDTLCYTASALSFMFENLGKPVIFTGAQIPICEVRSDGRENFIGGLIIAANYDIPEVLVYFNNKLFRANRCRKLDNSGLDAFGCPNFSPLASMEITIKVDWDEIFRSPIPMKVSLHTQLSRNVGLLRIFPSITIECVRAFLQEPIEGVVLQTFGAGNIPSNREDILDELKKACDRGVIIVNCSQCHRGNVSGHYATGKILYECGVISGADMTPEAALTKLAYVIGKSEWGLEKKRKMIGRNIRGELTSMHYPTESVRTSATRVAYSLGELDFIRAFTDFMRATSSDELHMIKAALFPPLLCHAAAAGDLEVMDSLKTNLNANLCAPDYDNRTALHVAASCGHAGVVRYLLRHGASVHVRDRWNDTPLLSAVKHRHFECIEMLVTAGAHLTLRPTVLGMELCIAADQGDIEKLRAWKLAGADLNSADYDGRTPLHIAAAKGHLSTSEFLLQEGANSEAKDAFGRTPLDEAQQHGHREIVFLLDHV